MLGYEIKRAVHGSGARTFRQFSHRGKERASLGGKKERKRDARERDFVPSISGFSDSPSVLSSREFHPPGRFSLLPPPCAIVGSRERAGERAANVEPGNLANDVLKIPDNVFPLLYGSLC